MTVVVLLLVLELVFRAFFPQPLYATALAPWGSWHQPNASFLHASDPHNEGKLLRGTEYLTHITYNSMGIRGPEYLIPKPSGVVRVVIVGDSFGDAMEVEFQQTMGQVVRQLLETRRTEFARRAAIPPAASVEAQPSLSSVLWTALRDDAASSGAPLLVASLRITADGQSPRATFLDSLGISWASVDLPPADRYLHDGHWNEQGNADAASRVVDKIKSLSLLAVGPTARVEVINLSHAAFDTCQYLQMYRALGRQFEPDLVLAVDSGSDSNGSTSDLCALDPGGHLALSSRHPTGLDQLMRNSRSLIRSNSHFLTWLFDLIDRSSHDRGPDRVTAPTP